MKKGQRTMAIVKISNQNMDKVTRYNLMKGNGADSLKNAAGSVLEITDYIINELDDDNMKLSLVTADGEMFVSTSQTCIKDFIDIADCWEEVLPPIEFFTATSKKGREFLSCRPANVR